MTETEQDIARQLARHPKWKWGRGMLSVWGNRIERVVLTADDGRGLLCGTDATSPEHYPDLSDPATQGCLIAMLGDRLIALERLGTLTGIFWRVEIWNERAATYDGWKLPGLGEALARAWLAANGGSNG